MPVQPTNTYRDSISYLTYYQDEITKAALTAIMSCYRIMFFHVCYKIKWQIAVNMDISCIASIQVINFLFYKIFPSHKKKKLEKAKIEEDVENIKIFMKSSCINAIIGLATIAIRTYVEAVYATLENRSLLIHFMKSSFAILTVSSIMKYSFGYTTKNILNVMSYHILWGAVAIFALLASNYFFDKSLKNYTIGHGLVFIKSLFIKNFEPMTV